MQVDFRQKELYGVIDIEELFYQISSLLLNM